MRTRIAGAIIIIISAITYFKELKGAIPLGILGIILLITPTKHAQEMLNLFIKSIKRWKTILLTALYDAIFWLLTSITILLSLKWMNVEAIQAQGKAALTSQGMINPETAAETAKALQKFIIHSIITGIILLIIILIIYTLSRGLIWTKIAKIKPNKKFFKKFLALNAIWWVIWIPIFLLIGATAKTNIKSGITGLFIIGFYFTPIIHTAFTKKQQIKQSLKSTVYGLTRIHKLIMPYTYAFLLYIIIYQPLRILQNTKIYQTITIILLVIYLAWLRTYLYEVIKQFK